MANHTKVFLFYIFLMVLFTLKINARGMRRNNVTFKDTKNAPLRGFSNSSLRKQNKNQVKRLAPIRRNTRVNKPRRPRRRPQKIRKVKKSFGPSYTMVTNIKLQSTLSTMLSRILIDNFNYIFSSKTIFTIYQIFRAEKRIAKRELLRVIIKSSGGIPGVNRYFGIELSFKNHQKVENWFDFDIIKYGFTPSLKLCYEFLGLETYLHGFEQLLPYMNVYRRLKGQKGRKGKISFNVVVKKEMKEFIFMIRKLIGLSTEPKKKKQIRQSRTGKLNLRSRNNSSHVQKKKHQLRRKSNIGKKLNQLQIKKSGLKQLNNIAKNKRIKKRSHILNKSGRKINKTNQSMKGSRNNSQGRRGLKNHSRSPRKKDSNVLIGDSLDEPDYIF